MCRDRAREGSQEEQETHIKCCTAIKGCFCPEETAKMGNKSHERQEILQLSGKQAACLKLLFRAGQERGIPKGAAIRCSRMVH